MKRFTDLSRDRLQEIYERVEAERPGLVQRLKENKFESVEDRAGHINGISFFVGSEVLKDFDDPLNREASNIAFDIYYFIIMGQEPRRRGQI